MAWTPRSAARLTIRSSCRKDSVGGDGPMWWASSAYRVWTASRSASEYTATVRIPSSRQARITRTAISPRLATRTFSNGLPFTGAPIVETVAAQGAIVPSGGTPHGVALAGAPLERRHRSLHAMGGRALSVTPGAKTGQDLGHVWHQIVVDLGRIDHQRPPRARPRSAPSGPGARPRSWSPTGQARARGAFRPSPSRQSRSRSPRRQPPLGGPRPPPRHLPVQIRGPVGRGHPGGHHHPPGPRGERGVDQDQPVRAPCRHRQLALPAPAAGLAGTGDRRSWDGRPESSPTPSGSRNGRDRPQPSNGSRSPAVPPTPTARGPAHPGRPIGGRGPFPARSPPPARAAPPPGSAPDRHPPPAGTPRGVLTPAMLAVYH